MLDVRPAVKAAALAAAPLALCVLLYAAPARSDDPEAVVAKLRFAGVAARELVALLPGAVPIDTLDLRISESGVPSEVQVGKYLTDRVFVRYGHVLGPEPEDQVRVELRLDEHWSLESDLSSNESAGADVIWSLDY
jgi:autotransporter translocation and assembly factor TamB